MGREGKAKRLGPTANTRNALARVLRYTSYCSAMVSLDAGAFACFSSIVCLVDEVEDYERTTSTTFLPGVREG